MEVAQIYEIMNDVTGEILGESAVLNEDLSNIVDIGTAVFNATDVDSYVRKLVNKVGKIIFVNRPYSGAVPSVLMDAWEFGSVLEKISADLPEAVENESWNLESGTSYDPNVFIAPVVEAKFFNKRVTFEVDLSFTELQVKQSFTSAEQLNGFLSMLYTAVDKSMTVKIDSLVMRTINYMIAATVKDDYASAAISSKSGVKAVNLLYLFNQRFNSGEGDTPLTAADALTTPEFIRFAAFMMGLYANRMSRITTLFNINGKDRFTPTDLLHVVLLNDFAQAANAYLQSDTYHDEYTKLPKAEVVPYWQGSGTSYAFGDVSKIYATLEDGESPVTVTGVLGIMFDRDALGVTNQDRRVTTNYNPKAEFYNNFYKFDCGCFVDPSEQAVVFFVA